MVGFFAYIFMHSRLWGKYQISLRWDLPALLAQPLNTTLAVYWPRIRRFPCNLHSLCLQSGVPVRFFSFSIDSCSWEVHQSQAHTVVCLRCDPSRFWGNHQLAVGSHVPIFRYFSGSYCRPTAASSATRRPPQAIRLGRCLFTFSSYGDPSRRKFSPRIFGRILDNTLSLLGYGDLRSNALECSEG